jgi:hypothetical protein
LFPSFFSGSFGATKMTTTGINNQNNTNMDTNNEFRAVIGTRKICYPFHNGQLCGILRYCLPYGVIPGVTITDKAALNEWVETEIERCIQEAEQFEKEAGKPLDN